MKNKTHKCVPENSQINLSVQEFEYQNKAGVLDTSFILLCIIPINDV